MAEATRKLGCTLLVDGRYCRRSNSASKRRLCVLRVVLCAAGGAARGFGDKTSVGPVVVWMFPASIVRH